MTNPRIAKRAYVVAFKRYLQQTNNVYTTIRPPRPRPPSRLLRWRPKPMDVDFPPLNVRMDIDQPHELEAVECPLSLGPCAQPESMDISPPSSPRQSRWERPSPYGVSPSAASCGQLALATPPPAPSAPRRSRWECPLRALSPSSAARGRLALARSPVRSASPSGLSRGRLASPTSPVLAACEDSSPAISVACVESFPTSVPASFDVRSTSRTLSAASSLSSSLASSTYVLSSGALPAATLPPSYVAPPVVAFPVEALPAATLPPSFVAPPVVALPVEALPSALILSSSADFSGPGTPGSSGKLPENGPLRKIAMPTGRFAFRSREFTSCKVPSSRLRSPSPPSRRSWERTRSPSPSAFCRRVRPRLTVIGRPAGGESPPVTPAIPIVRPRLVRSSVSLCVDEKATHHPIRSSLRPVARFSPFRRVTAKATPTMTAWRHRRPASPPSRDITPPPVASRERTLSPLDYEANLSPVNGPISVLVDDLEDVINALQPLENFQVLDDASSQPGSQRAEREEQNLRPPLAVLEDNSPSDGYSSDDSKVVAGGVSDPAG
ncbi:hypothetical protein INT44_005640 [Umbelopsis vinacea]|uniref:Uncharacterized protein n=1 Tax=Umbelopsis vinacea TaxID=44442 RepID=A0A8H7UEF4_9FUNG|nr:hypothetical protein INT44_005640 [Umbelopsis vinacea]